MQVYFIVNDTYCMLYLGAAKVSETPRSLSPELGDRNMYNTMHGAPPTSTKVPQLESKKVELDRLNERLRRQDCE